MNEWVKVSACTLPTVERPVRQAEFDELFKEVARVEEAYPDHIRLHLRRDAAVISRAASLAAKETGCCSFFSFDLRITKAEAVLSVVTDPGHEDVLTAFADRAKRVAA